MKGAFYTVGYTMSVTAVFVASVTILHLGTAERVGLNEMLFERRQVLMALGLAEQSRLPAKEVDRLFRTQVKRFRIGKTGEVVYAALAPNERIETYAFPIGGTGFWGLIYGYLGVSHDGKRLKGIAFTKHSETPGLGARIDEQPFREQFKDKSISQPQDGIFIRFVPEGIQLDSRSVHAITGATRTSMSLEAFLNEDVGQIKKALEAGDLSLIE